MASKRVYKHKYTMNDVGNIQAYINKMLASGHFSLSIKVWSDANIRDFGDPTYNTPYTHTIVDMMNECDRYYDNCDNGGCVELVLIARTGDELPIYHSEKNIHALTYDALKQAKKGVAI